MGGSCCSREGAFPQVQLKNHRQKMEEFHFKREQLLLESNQMSINKKSSQNKQLPQYLIQKSPEKQEKCEILLQAIKNNDFNQVKEMIINQEIDICQELGQDDQYWTCLHYACFFNRPNILRFLVIQTFQLKQNQYEEILNMPAYDYFTPFLIACAYDNANCVKLLQQYGGIQLYNQKFKKNAYQISKYFNSKKVIALFDIYQLQNKKIPDYIMINKEKFDKSDNLTLITEEASPLKKQFLNKSFQNLPQKGSSTEPTSNNIQDDQFSSVFNLLPEEDQYYQNQGRALYEEFYQNQKIFQDYDFSQDINSLTKVQDFTEKQLNANIKLQQQNQNPINNQFEHSSINLSARNPELFNTNLKKYATAQWVRPFQIFKTEDYHLFGEISEDSVNQGDCNMGFLFSILGQLAKFDANLIKKLFNNSCKNQLGIYSMILYPNGKKTEIIIDDYIPCYSDRYEPIFSKSSKQSLWVMLLEKAWAKNIGDYLSSQKVLVENAIEELLGIPASGYWVKNFTSIDLIQYFQEIQESQYINVAIAVTDANLQQLQAEHSQKSEILEIIKGIKPLGSYSILGIQNDKISLKFPVGFEQQIIELDVKLFQQLFQYFSVGFLEKNFHYNYRQIKSNQRHANYTLLYLEKQSKICIKLHQMFKKRIYGQDKTYNYAKCEFKLFYLSLDGNMHLVSEGHNIFTNYGNKSVPISDEPFLILEPGKYIIRVKVFRAIEEHQYNSYTLSTYSENPTILKPVNSSQSKVIMKEYYKDKIAKNVELRLIREPLYYFQFYWDEKFRLIMAFMNKNTEASTWQTTVVLNQKQNIKWSGRSNDCIENTIIVQPGEIQFLILKPIDIYTTCSCMWNMEHKHLDFSPKNTTMSLNIIQPNTLRTNSEQMQLSQKQNNTEMDEISIANNNEILINNNNSKLNEINLQNYKKEVSASVIGEKQ